MSAKLLHAFLNPSFRKAGDGSGSSSGMGSACVAGKKEISTVAPSQKQVDAAWDRIEKAQRELDDAISAYAALRAGNKTAGQQAQALIKDFIASWEKKYAGQTYVANWPRDTKAIKTMLKTLDAKDIEYRMTMFLQSSDRFYVEGRHDLAMFPSAANKFVPRSDLFSASGPVDCEHSPRCSSDQAHTARKIAERRQ